MANARNFDTVLDLDTLLKTAREGALEISPRGKLTAKQFEELSNTVKDLVKAIADDNIAIKSLVFDPEFASLNKQSKAATERILSAVVELVRSQRRSLESVKLGKDQRGVIAVPLPPSAARTPNEVYFEVHSRFLRDILGALEGKSALNNLAISRHCFDAAAAASLAVVAPRVAGLHLSDVAFGEAKELRALLNALEKSTALRCLELGKVVEADGKSSLWAADALASKLREVLASQQAYLTGVSLGEISLRGVAAGQAIANVEHLKELTLENVALEEEDARALFGGLRRTLVTLTYSTDDAPAYELALETLGGRIAQFERLETVQLGGVVPPSAAKLALALGGVERAGGRAVTLDVSRAKSAAFFKQLPHSFHGELSEGRPLSCALHIEFRPVDKPDPHARLVSWILQHKRWPLLLDDLPEAKHASLREIVQRIEKPEAVPPVGSVVYARLKRGRQHGTWPARVDAGPEGALVASWLGTRERTPISQVSVLSVEKGRGAFEAEENRRSVLDNIDARDHAQAPFERLAALALAEHARFQRNEPPSDLREIAFLQRTEEGARVSYRVSNGARASPAKLAEAPDNREAASSTPARRQEAAGPAEAESPVVSPGVEPEPLVLETPDGKALPESDADAAEGVRDEAMFDAPAHFGDGGAEPQQHLLGEREGETSRATALQSELEAVRAELAAAREARDAALEKAAEEAEGARRARRARDASERQRAAAEAKAAELAGAAEEKAALELRLAERERELEEARGLACESERRAAEKAGECGRLQAELEAEREDKAAAKRLLEKTLWEKAAIFAERRTLEGQCAALTAEKGALEGQKAALEEAKAALEGRLRGSAASALQLYQQLQGTIPQAASPAPQA
eukprot:tig00000692_g3198.t1